MQLNRNSRLVKFAYSIGPPEDRKVPNQTSLCAFFWRVVLFAPLFWSFAGVIVTFAAVVTSPVWVPIWLYAKYSGQTFEAAASSPFIGLAEKRSVQSSVQWLGEKKRKVCPLIKIA